MKQKAVFFGLAVVMLLSCTTLAVAQTKYTVQILANVKGANVYVDNEFVGNIPVIVKLTAGTHLIRLSANGYEDATKVLNVTGNTVVNITMNPAPTPPPSKVFNFEVTANVKGAKIFLNDVDTRQVTPYTFQLAAGVYVLKLTAPGYQDYEEKIMVNTNMSRYFEMVRLVMKYNLNVTANVANARVYIDDADYGQVPLKTVLEEGTYTVRVKAPGYNDYVTALVLKSNTNINAVLELAIKYYNLTVTANVAKAKVFINGKEGGNVPFTTSLPEGAYTITVKAIDYNDYSTTINLNKNTNLNAVLEPAVKYYNLNVTSNVRNALITIQGVTENEPLPFNRRLEAGTYTIKVRAKGYKPYEVTILLNKDTKVEAILETTQPIVKIIVPVEILNPKFKNWETQIDVYVDGKKQKGLEFEVTRGTHIIRVESGIFAWEKKFNFKEGITHIINISTDLEISEE